MVTIEAQIITVILWILAIKFCQITVYPYLRLALHNLSYGVAYPVGVLLLTLISWYLGLVGLPVQLALVFFLIIGLVALFKKQYSLEDLKQNYLWDCVFFAAFALMLTVQWFAPGIIPSGEKFMDAAFLTSIMANPTVTPIDTWFAGGDLSIYYYLAHWMCGVLGIISFGAGTVAFNLMIPTAFSLAAVCAYAIGVLILKRYRWIPMLVLILPNIALFVNIFSAEGISSIWWQSTRVIGNGATINEYPLFSFLWGDPHAHVIGCFNQLLFICLMMVMLKRWGCLCGYGRYLLICIIALSLGTMPVMNSWDVMVYAAVYIIVSVIVWKNYFNRKLSLRAVLPFVLGPVLSLSVYGIALFNMLSTGGSSVSGFFLVSSPSDFFEFIMCWGLFLAVFIIHGFSVLKKYPWLAAVPVVCFLFGYGAAGIAAFCIILIVLKKEKKPEAVFAVIGLALLIFIEIFYLKDYMGDEYYRMNTVFKFGFCAWFILATSALLMVGNRLRNKISPLNSKQKLWIALTAVVILSVAFVTCGINLGYGGGSLDAKAWMNDFYPGDSAGIDYLIENAQAGDVVVEAAGTSYTYSSRVSAMSGLSTLIGWSGHEFGWRSGLSEGEVMNRMYDTALIYENPDECLEISEKYGVDYIFVGSVEKTEYDVNLPKEGLEKVFSFEGTDVYKVI